MDSKKPPLRGHQSPGDGGLTLRMMRGLLQRADYPAKFEDWYFILFQSCQTCGLEGGGRIDGQGSLSVFGGCAQAPPRSR